MNKSIKKALVTGASLLMMASVGAGASQVISPVHARSLVNVADNTEFGKYVPWHHRHYIGHGVGARQTDDRPSWFRKNGHIFHMNTMADITSIDGIYKPTKSQVRRALIGYRPRRTRYHKHSNKIKEEWNRIVKDHIREKRQDKREKKALKASIIKTNIRNACRKIYRKVRMPSQLNGAWKRGKREIIFKPLIRRTMNKLVNHVNSDKSSDIINDYLESTHHEQIKSLRHNQYVIENNHDKIQGSYLRYKVTVLNHHEIRISKYGKSGLLPAPAGIYKRDKSVNTSRIDDLPYGITYIVRNGSSVKIL